MCCSERASVFNLSHRRNSTTSTSNDFLSSAAGSRRVTDVDSHPFMHFFSSLAHFLYHIIFAVTPFGSPLPSGLHISPNTQTTPLLSSHHAVRISCRPFTPNLRSLHQVHLKGEFSRIEGRFCGRIRNQKYLTCYTVDSFFIDFSLKE